MDNPWDEHDDFDALLPPLKTGWGGTTALAAPPPTPTVAWYRFPPKYNVHEFGVLGTTDDSRVLQMALDVVAQSGGGELEWPGLYRVASPLLLKSDNVRLAGWNRWLCGATAAFEGPILKGDGKRHLALTVRDMGFFGVGADNLVLLNDIDSARFYDVNVIGAQTAIQVAGSVGSTRSEFHGMLIGKANTGISFGYRSNSCFVEGGHIQSCNLAVMVLDQKSANNIALHHVTMESVRPSARGVCVWGTNFSMVSCRLEFTDALGIGIEIKPSAYFYHIAGNTYSVADFKRAILKPATLAGVDLDLWSGRVVN